MFVTIFGAASMAVCLMRIIEAVDDPHKKKNARGCGDPQTFRCKKHQKDMIIVA